MLLWTRTTCSIQNTHQVINIYQRIDTNFNTTSSTYSNLLHINKYNYTSISFSGIFINELFFNSANFLASELS